MQDMPNPDPNRAAATLLGVLGGAFIVNAVQGVVVAAITGGNYSVTSAVVFLSIGLLLFASGLGWNRIRGRIGDTLATSVTRVASDFRYWLALIFLPWIYVAWIDTLAEIRRNNEIVALRNDVQSIAKVIDRVVLPRHLTKRQQAVISGFLSQFEPKEYSFRLSARDEEVGSFRSDIEQALIKAGWTRSSTNPYVYADDVQEGLSINFTQTMEHAQKANDPRNPNPSVLLQEAFGLAGVRINGTGGGSGINVTQDLFVISIGHPRKDSYELTVPDN